METDGRNSILHDQVLSVNLLLPEMDHTKIHCKDPFSVITLTQSVALSKSFEDCGPYDI